MATFDEAFRFMAPHEWRPSDPTGGYTDDKADPGGETRFGISKRYHPAVDIANLTLDQARDIYRQEYWNGFDKLSDQRVASKLFDMSVNPGTHQAVIMLQQACGDCGNPTGCDGKFGPMTVAAANACNPDNLLNALCSRLNEYYHNVVTRDPAKQKFLNGWLTRADDKPNA